MFTDRVVHKILLDTLEHLVIGTWVVRLRGFAWLGFSWGLSFATLFLLELHRCCGAVRLADWHLEEALEPCLWNSRFCAPARLRLSWACSLRFRFKGFSLVIILEMASDV